MPLFTLPSLLCLLQNFSGSDQSAPSAKGPLFQALDYCLCPHPNGAILAVSTGFLIQRPVPTPGFHPPDLLPRNRVCPGDCDVPDLGPPLAAHPLSLFCFLLPMLHLEPWAPRAWSWHLLPWCTLLHEPAAALGRAVSKPADGNRVQSHSLLRRLTLQSARSLMHGAHGHLRSAAALFDSVPQKRVHWLLLAHLASQMFLPPSDSLLPPDPPTKCHAHHHISFPFPSAC